MKNGYTFTDLIDEVLNKANMPLTREEIWDKANEYGIVENKLKKYGKTPCDSIGAKLYCEIKENGECSKYCITSKRPTKFFFRGKDINSIEIQQNIKSVEKENSTQNKSIYKEIDLHPLLVKFVYSNIHFNCYAKTINQSKTKSKNRGPNAKKGLDEWLHPDIVGVYFPFDDYEKKTLELLRSININSVKLFSFEMKQKLNYNVLRQCYFQAVSNSSWANEGYLVALEVDEDPGFRDELNRLSNAFGIGIIQLDAHNIDESKIICPARYNEIIDWDTVDRLVDESIDFEEFISNLLEDLTINKVKSKYDHVYKDDEMENYVKEKKIIKE